MGRIETCGQQPIDTMSVPIDADVFWLLLQGQLHQVGGDEGRMDDIAVSPFVQRVDVLGFVAELKELPVSVLQELAKALIHHVLVVTFLEQVRLQVFHFDYFGLAEAHPSVDFVEVTFDRQ